LVFSRALVFAVGLATNAVGDEAGVGVLSQSGGLGADILRRGQTRGLRFNSLVTLGNSADLGAAELLRPMLDDPDIQVIGLYLVLYSTARFVIEFFREHEQSLVGPFSLTQWIALGLLLLGILILARGGARNMLRENETAGARA